MYYFEVEKKLNPTREIKTFKRQNFEGTMFRDPNRTHFLRQENMIQLMKILLDEI